MEQLKLNIPIKKLSSSAVIPTYATDFSGGMDMTTVSIETTDKYIEYGTGISMEIPEGFIGLLFPRSSNSKKDLLLCNSVGVIDSDYRGEIKFRFKKIYNPKETQDFHRINDKIGQIIIMPFPKVTFTEVQELNDSVRGDGGFGSTGK